MEHTLALISLGCPKNLVNSEQMLFMLTDAGLKLVAEPEGADIVLINTCGFIDAAKQEAIDTIIQIGQLKAEGKCGKIIVAGCLAERYKDSILDEFPEIDAVIGVGSFSEIVAAAEAVLNNEFYSSFKSHDAPVDEIPRVISTGPAWAYLRIAEGCNNYCAFCAIPYIRGKYRSRSMENVLAEAKDLAEHGVKEIIIIAQDITKYGTDLYNKHSLAELCRKISEIEGVEWIRLHYLYADQIDDELIDEIARNPKIVKYLDIPLQHINDKILKKMNRRDTSAGIRSLLKKLREKIPGVCIRTSLIAGLPGEGEEEFEELCEFLKEAKIERAGCFVFSPEEGTPAALMERPDSEIAARRAELVMELQSKIMDEFCESFIGKTIPVICDEYDSENEVFTGRSYADSPDIDGLVFFYSDYEPDSVVGNIINVKINEVEDGYLYGET